MKIGASVGKYFNYKYYVSLSLVDNKNYFGDITLFKIRISYVDLRKPRLFPNMLDKCGDTSQGSEL